MSAGSLASRGFFDVRGYAGILRRSNAHCSPSIWMKRTNDQGWAGSVTELGAESLKAMFRSSLHVDTQLDLRMLRHALSSQDTALGRK